MDYYKDTPNDKEKKARVVRVLIYICSGVFLAVLISGLVMFLVVANTYTLPARVWVASPVVSELVRARWPELSEDGAAGLASFLLPSTNLAALANLSHAQQLVADAKTLSLRIPGLAPSEAFLLVSRLEPTLLCHLFRGQRKDVYVHYVVHQLEVAADLEWRARLMRPLAPATQAFCLAPQPGGGRVRGPVIDT